MTTTEGVSCMVCGKQRAPGEIHYRVSRLIANKQILICNKCESERKEPRAFIIIVARTKGYLLVRDYILQDRYVGQTIEAKEILV